MSGIRSTGDECMGVAHQRFPLDSRMPALAVAVDPVAMCRLFATRLWAGGPHDSRVERCEITRIRYRPGTRCLFQYAVTLRDARTAAISRQWVTGSLYAEPERAARLARREPDAVFIPEVRMVVNRFPSDRKLPQSAAVMTGTDPELLAEMRRSCGDPTWTIDRVSVEPVRYREHLSLVVRYTVRIRNARSGETGEKIFYLKAYPEAGMALDAFKFLHELAAHAAADLGGIRIDAPVAVIGRLRAILLRSTEGRPLSEIISGDDEGQAIRAARDAARGLARFNLSDAPMRRRYSSAEYLRSLERPVAILRWACPELGPDLQVVMAAVARAAHDADARPTHRDMKPEHVLLDGGVAAFIDLDSAAAADPLLDAALMLARFAGAADDDEERPGRTRMLSAAFHDEYFARVPPAWRERLPAFYASSLVEVAAGLFHRQEAQWEPRVRKLVRSAAEATAEAPSAHHASKGRRQHHHPGQDQQPQHAALEGHRAHADVDLRAV